MSDQDFFFDDDKPAAKGGSSSNATKSGKPGAPKSAQKASKPGAKSTTTKKGSSKKAEPEKSGVSPAIAMLFAFISLLLGVIIGLYLNTLTGGAIGAFGQSGSTTAEPTAAERGIQSTHPDITGGADGASGGSTP